MIEGAQKERRQLEKRINYLDTERKRMERLYSQALQKSVDLKNERLELKQKLRCWYKQEAWFHLPLEVREHFWELLKEKEAKPT